MHPAGEAEVERARAGGRWQAAYAGPATIEVPDDLADALAAEPRTRRIGQYVAMLARGGTIYP